MRSFAALCYVMSCYAIPFHPPSYPILFHSILSFDKLSASLIISDLVIYACSLGYLQEISN